MPRPAAPAALAALLALLPLAGCLGGAGPPDPAPAPAARLPGTGFAYACPPGASTRLPGDVCVASLWDARETLEEPWLAAHPARPGVLALGLNAWHAEPRPRLVPGEAGAELVRMDVHVTEDAGASWRRLDLPGLRFADASAWPVHGSADPSLAFDAQGVLHVTQLNTGFSGPFWFDIQYMRSADLGRTWSEPVLLAADGDNDRNWLEVGPDGTLWVAWRNPLREPLPPSLAWSRDGGASWEGPSSPSSDCTQGSRPLPLAGGVLLACEGPQGEAPRIELHRFDPATLAWTALSRVPAPQGWEPGSPMYAMPAARPDGTVAVLPRQGQPGAFLALSRDGGARWEEPRPLAGLCACGGRERLVVYWAGFDPWGQLHVLLRDGYVATPDQASEDNVRYAQGDLSTWHLVVDVDAGEAVQEAILVGPGPEYRRVPQGAAVPIGRDDYYRPAFGPDGGALAWTRDKAIDVTLLEPLPGPAAPAAGPAGGAARGSGGTAPPAGSAGGRTAG